MKSLKQQLIAAGHPLSAIKDYLDSCAYPSVEGFGEYVEQCDEEYDAQVRWDASQRRDPIFPKPRYWYG